MTAVDIDEDTGEVKHDGSGYLVLEHGPTRRAAKGNRVSRRDISPDDTQTEIVAWVQERLGELRSEAGSTWVIGYRRGSSSPEDSFKVESSAEVTGMGLTADLGAVGALAASLERISFELLHTHRHDQQVIANLATGQLGQVYELGELHGTARSASNVEVEAIRAEALKAVAPIIAPIIAQAMASSGKPNTNDQEGLEQPDERSAARLEWNLGIIQQLAVDSVALVGEGVELTDEQRTQLENLHAQLGLVVAA